MTGLFDLTGHVALVTGGNAGLGLGMARGLARAGASLAIWGRNAARNRDAAEEFRAPGGKEEGFACDVMDPAAVERAMAATVARFGRVDSCFANAGGSGVRTTAGNRSSRCELEPAEARASVRAQRLVPRGVVGLERHDRADDHRDGDVFQALPVHAPAQEVRTRRSRQA